MFHMKSSEATILQLTQCLLFLPPLPRLNKGIINIVFLRQYPTGWPDLLEWGYVMFLFTAASEPKVLRSTRKRHNRSLNGETAGRGITCHGTNGYRQISMSGLIFFVIGKGGMWTDSLTGLLFALQNTNLKDDTWSRSMCPLILQ